MYIFIDIFKYFIPKIEHYLLLLTNRYRERPPDFFKMPDMMISWGLAKTSKLPYLKSFWFLYSRTLYFPILILLYKIPHVTKFQVADQDNQDGHA